MPNKSLLFTGGCLAGAVGMYYADPHRGAYRRAILRDKGIHYHKEIRRQAEIAGRDLSHRTRGIAYEFRSRFFPKPVADDILVARVASKIGRVVANPHSIGVTADRGKVILTGPVFSDEAEPLFHIVRQIPGVRGLENHLEPHSRSERVSGLQGHRRSRSLLRRRGLALLEGNWTPALRLLISVAGGLAAVSGSMATLRRKLA